MGIAAGLAAVGSVCGAVVTDAVQHVPQGSASGYWNLAGLVLGAVLPQLVGAAGAYWRLRATVGIAVTVAAILVVYSGLATARKVRALEDLVPSLPGVAAVVDRDPPVVRGSAAEAGAPGIEVVPAGPLTCTPAGCPDPVTIRSTGTSPLRIDKIGFDGPAAQEFEHRGQCEHRQFAPGEKCLLRIGFAPSEAGTRRARLVVNQNLAGPPSYLAVEGQAPIRQADLAPSARGAGCELVKAGGRHQVRVKFLLVHDGAKIGTSKVGVAARGDTGTAVAYRSAIGPSSFTIPVVLGHKAVVVVTVDPAGEVAERDEANNRMRITATVPAKPGERVACQFEE
ncbi:hypothetical protein [Saccharothrix stipae]